MTLYSRYFALVTITLGSGAANAASFNCAAAKHPVEIAICSSPELSEADERLSATYHSLLDKLTPGAAEKLTKVQRHFNAVVRNWYVNVKAHPENLLSVYDKRTTLLNTLDKSGLAITLNGRFVNESGHDEYPIDAIWPEIDKPNELATAFNDKVRSIVDQMVPEKRSDRSYVFSFAINAIDEGIISINFDSSYFPSPAMGRGYYEWATLSFSPRKMREPKDTDFFIPGSGWVEALHRACKSEYKDADISLSIETNVSEWSISSKEVQFDCADQFQNNLPAPSAKLSWDALRAFLKPDAPIPHELPDHRSCVGATVVGPGDDCPD